MKDAAHKDDSVF